MNVWRTMTGLYILVVLMGVVAIAGCFLDIEWLWHWGGLLVLIVQTVMIVIGLRTLR